MHRQTFTIVLASMIALGCDSDPPGTIAGIVDIRVQGRSVAPATRNIAIAIVDGDRTTTVNADGYRFEDVPADTYRLVASATDDVPEPCRRHISGGRSSVRVVAGETTTADIPIDGRSIPGDCFKHILSPPE